MRFLVFPESENDCFIIEQMSVYLSVFRKHKHIANTRILEMESPRGL